MGSSEHAAHWDSVYRTRSTTSLSWFQPESSVALRLIDSLGIDKDAPVVDVGGGTSALADGLLERGFTDVSVLDVSRAALEEARERLGPRGDRVHWLHEDVLDWRPSRRYAVWHDRATFHFLVSEEARVRYRAALAQGLADGGTVVMATFAEDGPEQCSGLPVARYGPSQLVAELGGRQIITSEREEHVTPAGGTQLFTWVVAR